MTGALTRGVVERVLLGTPVYTLTGYNGMGAAPGALRRAGLAGAVRGTDLGDISLPPLKKNISDGKTKNLGHFRDATSRIYSATRMMGAEQVVIIGGECSLTVGATAGLWEAFGGKPGMLWLDAHGDFNTPETSPSGYIGGMCLAMACGRARGLGLGVGDEKLALAEERLVHVGSRALDQPEIAAFSSSPAKLYTTQHVKKSGAAEVAEEAARHLDNRSDWVVCHLDVDVVDPVFIPSVNYPTPGGLTPEETIAVVGALSRTGKLKALEIAAYDSAQDNGGATASRIVGLVRSMLG